MSDEHQESTFSTCRKLRLENPTLWSHHFGGWTYTVNLIEQNLCCDDGLLFVTSVEDLATEEAQVYAYLLVFILFSKSISLRTDIKV